MFRRALFPFLRVLLLPRLIRETLQRRRVTIVHYHAVPPETLDRDLAELTRRYRFVSLREYLDSRAAGTSHRLPAKAMVLAFDDGRRETRALLPVLAKHRVPAVMFVCTGLVGTRRRFWFRGPAARRDLARLLRVEDDERMLRLRALGFEEEGEHESREALSWEEMDEMREWVDFQPHTVFHPVLPRCDERRVWEELVRSKADLQARGYPVYAFAYPHGAYGEREVALVRAAGFECALTADLGFNSPGTDPFRLKRICLNDAGGPSENLVKASGLWGVLRRVLGKDRAPRRSVARVRWFEQAPVPAAPNPRAIPAPRPGGEETPVPVLSRERGETWFQ